MGSLSGEKRLDNQGAFFWPSLLPALLVAIIYLPAVWFDFISLDDNLYLLDNPSIKLGLSWEGLKWAFTTLYTTNWHPLTWLSLLGEYQLFGFNPLGYHIVGIVLHAVNSSLLFFVLRGLTAEKWKSVAVASLFAIHPLNVESVAWIAERKNLLSTLFWILTIWSYTRYVRRPGAVGYLAAALTFTLGLMAKPMAVSLPVVLLLLDYWPLRRFPLAENHLTKQPSFVKNVRTFLSLLPEKIPFFIISFCSALITIYAAKSGGAAKSLLTFPLSVRFENALLSYFSYLGMLIRPVELAIFYPYPRFIPLGNVIAAFLFLAAVTILVVFNAKKYGYLAVGWFWYLITLLPVIGILQVGRQAMANRYAYIPFIGIFIIMIWGIDDSSRRLKKFKHVSIVSVFLMIVYWGSSSALELDYWKNSQVAYARALEITKDNHIATLGMGNVMLSEGNLAGAEKNYRETLRIRPDYELAHYNLGLTLMRQGKTREAECSFREAVKYDPLFAKAYNELGTLLVQEGNKAEAKRYFEKAIALDPEYVKPRENLALLLKTAADRKPPINPHARRGHNE